MKYNPSIIEPKWQEYWEKNNTFVTPRLPSGKKLYILDMFPYPSGNGLHVGHPEGYTATDIVSRFEIMNGSTVLHPMGWDAFGLPAEQQAKKTGTPPRKITETNIANFRRQLKMLGYAYDWSRELATTDIKYFKWTQYIFILLYNTWFDPEKQKGRPISELPIPSNVADPELYKDEHRLAYQIEAPVNWCSALGTVLSNEEVIQGRSERGNHPVIRIPLRQWMLRITAYADRLENDLDNLDWSESIKTLQKNWIGRSTGAEVDFYIGDLFSVTKNKSGRQEPDINGFIEWKKEREKSGFPRKPESGVLRIYTTRPDTLFGATYMVIAPEHPLVKKITTDKERPIVENYCEQAASKSDLDRTDLAKEKTGVFTGSFAINPLTGKPVPIWVADYVLSSYGTGAIMAVPAHDTRDFEFAKTFNLPIIQVVQKNSAESNIIVTNIIELEEAFTGQGTAVNSGQYDGLNTVKFKECITEDLHKSGIGCKAVNYKIRDWLFSRQHFWGEPFPILHELDDSDNLTGRTITLDESELPLDIPEGLTFDAEYNTPEPPLEHAPKDWLYIFRNNKKYKRETNTMPQWAGSCWYYLRYIDPHNEKTLVDPELERAWSPVDLYVGGAEHAVLHLLYARFWHKVLYDYGIVSYPEPFQKLVNQGMILGEMEFTGFKNSTNGNWISTTQINIGRDGIGTLKSEPDVKLQSVKLDNKQVIKRGENFILAENEQIQVDSRANKMSKSRGNVINPDTVVEQYGADALRLYEMFMGPLESVKPWSMDGVHGVRGFLDRVWKMIAAVNDENNKLEQSVKDIPLTETQNRILHKTIKNVTEDIRSMSFNTAIARMMEFTNFFLKEQVRPKSAMEKFVILLSPFAPHIAEELWSILGHNKTIAFEKWPSFDQSAIEESMVEIPISINGKLKSKIIVAVNADETTLEKMAIADSKISNLIEGKTIVKKIIVRGKMINLVIKE
ncbi:MAG: leucine--tRNA ligase [Planctomycetaceae bacterium]|jgi:leucyl-tRNA synthetase|nr:leucine--tRNA ligase [Planctomycetaceae bacterium]